MKKDKQPRVWTTKEVQDVLFDYQKAVKDLEKLNAELVEREKQHVKDFSELADINSDLKQQLKDFRDFLEILKRK